MDETPLRERIMSRRSPSHVKTLDLLAKSTKFPSQSVANLKKYCMLARTEGGATSASAAGDFLLQRYGWDVKSRAAEVEEAWASTANTSTTPTSATPSATPLTSPIAEEPTKKNSVAKGEAATVVPLVYPDRVYLSLKKDACSKCTLLCQIEDHQRVKFTGDAGAIGRLTIKEDSDLITIDLKGMMGMTACVVVSWLPRAIDCDVT